MGFSIGKKEEKEKKLKTRPQVDSNPRSTGPEASTLPADPFYFVVIICRLRETDFQKSMTTAEAAAEAAATVRRSTRSSGNSRSCSRRESSISPDACRSPSSREEAPYIRDRVNTDVNETIDPRT